MPSSSPSTIIASALRIEPCASAIEAIRPSTISEKYSGAPKLSAARASGGAATARISVATDAGEERAERRGGERRPRPALARHLVAVDGGHRRGGFARQVDQDRRGRAAVLRAVVDAGQHDQRRHRLEAEGDRQQHRDGRGRPDARQHADQRAEQHADEAVEQVDRGQRRLRRPSARLAIRSMRSATAARGRTAAPAPRARDGRSRTQNTRQRRAAIGGRPREGVLDARERRDEAP